MRRWHIFTIGAVLALGLGMRMLVVAAWVGGKTLSVKVLVIDSEVPCPVTGAQVVAFRRPFSLWEGDITRRKPADFIPHTGSPETKSFVDGDKG